MLWQLQLQWQVIAHKAFASIDSFYLLVTDVTMISNTISWMTGSADKESGQLVYVNGKPACTKFLDSIAVASPSDSTVGKDFDQEEMVCPRGSP